MSTGKECEFDIFSEDFPDNVSISDLCDCGRHKRRNKPQFVRRRCEFPETDYKSTFVAVKQPRPRSTKKPPPSPREMNPPPMVFDTNQRSEFKVPSQTERTKPIIREEKYEKPTVPLDGQSYYQKEFTPKHLLPEIRQVPRQDALKVSPAKFDSTTTSQQHFKQWVPQPSMAFGELPSFTGSILFPEKDPLPNSTMKNSYTGLYAPPAELYKTTETNIKIEGDMSFGTTHNNTFKKIDGDHRVHMITHQADIPLQKRGKFRGETQSKADFPGYRGHQPPPPKPVDPPQPTIDLKFDNKTMFETVQRSTFKGHDVVRYPPSLSCKKEEEGYQPSAAKFESETSQRRDFKPIDVTSVSQQKASVPTSKLHTSPDVKFEDRTMNKEFFKNWGVAPRVRYGDFHENKIYMPPQIRFEGESVAQSSFTKKRGEPARSYKPEERAKTSKGKNDYTTSYSDTYKGEKARMCRAQVYLMQQEIKKRRAAGQNPEVPNSLIFAK